MRTLVILCGLFLLCGCKHSTSPNGSTSDSQRAEFAEIRSDLDQIPAPVKSKYLTVKSLSAWENPYLTVQESMVTLHVTVADANTSELGVGGLLRPLGARRQNLDVRISDLPAALNAIPQTAWPYGRVVAVEEAHGAPPTAEPALRRNLESVIRTLGNLDIVVYEWQEGGPPGLR